MATIKGQNLRIMLAGPSEADPTCVAAARSCTIHLALQLQDTSTKDSEGAWIEQEPVGISWDAQVEALVTNNAESSAHKAGELVVGQKYLLVFSRTSTAAGGKNRASIDSEMNLAGYAICSDFQAQAANKQPGVVTAQFTGDGDLHFTPAPIKDWVNSKQLGTFSGIAKITTTGPSYTVAVAEGGSYGTALFMIAHDGICTTPTGDGGVVTGISDLSDAYTVEDSYDGVKSWVENMGYYMPDLSDAVVYDYSDIVGTAIIGQQYLGELEPIN